MAGTDVNDAPFSLHIEGETTGELFKGEFRAKTRLSHRDSLVKDKLRRELLGTDGAGAGSRAASIAMIVSELAVRVTKAPKWWDETENGLNLVDDAVVGAIFDACMKVESDALAEKKKKAEEAQAELKKLEEK